MASARSWVAVTSTDEMPVDLAPVRAALKGVAPVRVVALPVRPLGPAETAAYAAELAGAAGMLLRPGYVTGERLYVHGGGQL